MHTGHRSHSERERELLATLFFSALVTIRHILIYVHLFRTDYNNAPLLDNKYTGQAMDWLYTDSDSQVEQRKLRQNKAIACVWALQGCTTTCRRLIQSTGHGRVLACTGSLTSVRLCGPGLGKTGTSLLNVASDRFDLLSRQTKTRQIEQCTTRSGMNGSNTRNTPIWQQNSVQRPAKVHAEIALTKRVLWQVVRHLGRNKSVYTLVDRAA